MAQNMEGSEARWKLGSVQRKMSIGWIDTACDCCGNASVSLRSSFCFVSIVCGYNPECRFTTVILWIILQCVVGGEPVWTGVCIAWGGDQRGGGVSHLTQNSHGMGHPDGCKELLTCLWLLSAQPLRTMAGTWDVTLGFKTKFMYINEGASV